MALYSNRGRPASNRLSAKTRQRVLELVKKKYVGFNDTHLCEVLAEREKIVLGRETLRSLLRREGLGPKRKRRVRQHRRRRDPRSCRGMMVQWDGSWHPWLGPEHPKWTLMAAVDDADGKVASAFFTRRETSAAYFGLLKGVLKRSGIPQNVYQDRHGALRRNDGYWSLEEQLAGEQTPTQVGQALRDLGIEPIFARSAQGKGRIERFFGVAQDRLVAELCSRGIEEMEEANAYLASEWLADFNRRFGRAPRKAESAYRSVRGLDLRQILSFRYQRVVSNDNVVVLGDVEIAIPPGPRRRSYAKARVDVRQHLDGSWSVYYQGTRIAQHNATVLSEPQRVRVKTRRSRPAKGADEAVLVYFPALDLDPHNPTVAIR
ncbi:MAG: ISNCY family transposase [bacterium]|nr:ISNCY family transposase [bacterium]